MTDYRHERHELSQPPRRLAAVCVHDSSKAKQYPTPEPFPRAPGRLVRTFNVVSDLAARLWVIGLLPNFRRPGSPSPPLRPSCYFTAALPYHCSLPVCNLWMDGPKINRPDHNLTRQKDDHDTRHTFTHAFELLTRQRFVSSVMILACLVIPSTILLIAWSTMRIFPDCYYFSSG